MAQDETTSGTGPGGRCVLLLGWGIVWRMTVWGLGAGVALGILYGCAVVFLVGSLYGILFGAVLGFGTGLLCGIAMAALTLIIRPHSRKGSRFVQVLSLVPVGVILTLEALIIILTVATDWRFHHNAYSLFEFSAQEWTRLINNRWQVLVYYVPGLIGIIPAWYAGRHVAQWAAGD